MWVVRGIRFDSGASDKRNNQIQNKLIKKYYKI